MALKRNCSRRIREGDQNAKFQQWVGHVFSFSAAQPRLEGSLKHRTVSQGQTKLQKKASFCGPRNKKGDS